jgi:hypothetical protein
MLTTQGETVAEQTVTERSQVPGDGGSDRSKSERPLDMSGKASPADLRTNGTASGTGSGTGSVVEGGWIQVNNTLVPYVKHGSSRLLPLSVLRNAANLLQERGIPHQPAKPQDSARLNACCKETDVDFRFARHTKLVTLENLVANDHQVLLKELPDGGNPFEHAEEQCVKASPPLSDKVPVTDHVITLEGSPWQPINYHHLPLMAYPHIAGFGLQSVHDHLVRKPVPLIPVPDVALSRQV